MLLIDVLIILLLNTFDDEQKKRKMEERQEIRNQERGNYNVDRTLRPYSSKRKRYL